MSSDFFYILYFICNSYIKVFMKLPITISKYIGKKFLIAVGITLFVLLGLIVLIDTVELLRRASGKDVPFGIVIQLAFLKLPMMIQKLAPFIVLIGATLAYAKLTKTRELVVVRASGVSAWKFLAPAVIVACTIAVLFTTVITPLSSTMLSRYERIEGKHLKGRVSTLAISSSGLWLKQRHNSTEIIIHALRVSQKDRRLFDTIIFVFEGDDFAKRIDAETASLEKGYWALDDALITYPNKKAERVGKYILKTNFTFKDIQESFAPPESLSFWELPPFIKTLEDAGFPAVRHKLYWHSMLASPILLSAMVLISAVFSLRISNRRGKVGTLIGASILTGFMIYFLSDIVAALGMSGTIPVAMAAWIPATISLLIGITFLLHLEEG